MTATDVIGWTTSDASVYCPACKPEPISGSSLTIGPVFESDRESFSDGGLACDHCSAEIVESDTCRTCDRSLRDDHDDYAFGTVNGIARKLVHAYGQCRPHNVAVIRVRERCGRADSIAVYAQVVPFGAGADDGPDDALAAIVAAYSGTVATFELLEVELIEA